jgi:hypothetical protein
MRVNRLSCARNVRVKALHMRPCLPEDIVDFACV